MNRPVRMVMPVYPEAALKMRLQGSVLVTYRIDQEGYPIALEIKGSNPEGVFENAVASALRQYRFKSLPQSSASISSIIKSKFVFKYSGASGTVGMTSVYFSYPINNYKEI